MPTPRDILFHFVLPALLVTAAMAVGWAGRRKGRWIGAIAVSAAFAWADSGISGYPAWPPGSGDAAYYLIWFAAPIGVLGLLDALFPIPIWPRATAVWILCRIGAGLLLAPLAHGNLWAMQIAADFVALIGAVWFVTWETLAARQQGMTVPILLALEAAAAGGIFALANDIKPSQAAVAMMGMAIAITVAAWLWPHLSLDRGTAAAFVLPLLGMFALAHFYYYTEPPLLAAAVFLASPLLGFLGDLAYVKALGPKWHFTARVLPVLLGLCLAVGITARQFLAASGQPSAQPAVQPQDE